MFSYVNVGCDLNTMLVGHIAGWFSHDCCFVLRSEDEPGIVISYEDRRSMTLMWRE